MPASSPERFELNPALRKHYQDLKAARPAGATQVSLES